MDLNAKVYGALLTAMRPAFGPLVLGVAVVFMAALGCGLRDVVDHPAVGLEFLFVCGLIALGAYAALRRRVVLDASCIEVHSATTTETSAHNAVACIDIESPNLPGGSTTAVLVLPDRRQVRLPIFNVGYTGVGSEQHHR